MYGSTSMYDEPITVDPPSSPNEIVEVIRKKRYKETFPPYSIVGNGKTSRTRGKSMDIVDVCSQFNIAENRLLQFFRDRILDNNVNKELNPNVVIPTNHKDFDQYLKTALKKNFPHMEYMEVIRRVKRGTYMVNPALFIPTEGYTAIKAQWDSLALEEDDE